MLSPEVKRNISRIIPFGLIGLLFGIVYTLLEWGHLRDLAHDPSTGSPYNFGNAISVRAGTSFLSGLLMGTIEILYLSKLFRQKSFAAKIVYKALLYLTVIISLLLMGAAISYAANLNSGVFTKRVWDKVWAFYLSYAFIGFEVYMAVVIGISLFYTEVSENLGQGVLANFFTGKYHTPIEEERIYMFLDMKSSTTIAEKLGHVRYFEMLREYYVDLSAPIVKYAGEIYQYVGDEVIVSWTLKKGLQNNNCLRCFFAMKEALAKQARKYQERFEERPTFKAGLHLGKVTTGEIGVIIKDIMFTGDVLNTTARIQGLCNTYNVDILISYDPRKKLAIDGHWEIKPMGENELRGRDEKITLFTVLSS